MEQAEEVAGGGNWDSWTQTRNDLSDTYLTQAMGPTDGSMSMLVALVIAMAVTAGCLYKFGFFRSCRILLPFCTVGLVLTIPMAVLQPYPIDRYFFPPVAFLIGIFLSLTVVLILAQLGIFRPSEEGPKDSEAAVCKGA